MRRRIQSVFQKKRKKKEFHPNLEDAYKTTENTKHSFTKSSPQSITDPCFAFPPLILFYENVDIQLIITSDVVVDPRIQLLFHFGISFIIFKSVTKLS